MAVALDIHGEVAPGFEAVADTFRANFTERREVGAAVSCWHRGERVVDLWAGWADPAAKTPWNADTLGIVFSATKGLVALSFLMLAERGAFDYDQPVAEYWPEFAEAGKGSITVRQLLNHRSGLCAIDAPLTIEDFHHPARVEAALVAQKPLWPPGEGQGYHAISYGPFAAALFERIAGTTLGAFLRDEVAGPLDADVFLGLPEELNPRVARLLPPGLREKLFEILPALFTDSTEGRLYRQALKRGSDTQRATSNPAELGARALHNYDRADVRALELPWANGIASARGLAKIYAALAGGGSLGGVQLLKPESLELVRERQSYGPDRVLQKTLGWSLGFIKEEPHLFSPNEAAIGHPGAGGAIGLADPSEELSVAYVMNRMDTRLRSPRALALCQSLYGCLSGL